MAQFAIHGRLKLIFNGEGMLCRLEQKDPFRFKLESAQIGKRKLKYVGSPTRLYSSPSSTNYNSTRYRVEAHLIFSDVGSSDEYESDPEDEFGNDELAYFKGLVLDVAYRPVNVVGWKRAICLEFMEKVPHLLQVVKRRIVKRTLCRRNVLYRDNYTCQYCLSRENLTIDHVVPASRGGEWEWENLVAACAKCNSKKGKKTLEEANMKLLKTPKAPKDYDVLAIPLTSGAVRMLASRKETPEEWRQYLAKPSQP